MSTLRYAFESSGRRWFILGVMLLVVMGMAVWSVRHNPFSISGLFFAIAAILGTVPKIMEARARILFGLAGAVRPDAEAAPEADAAKRPKIGADQA